MVDKKIWYIAKLLRNELEDLQTKPKIAIFWSRCLGFFTYALIQVIFHIINASIAYFIRFLSIKSKKCNTSQNWASKFGVIYPVRWLHVTECSFKQIWASWFLTTVQTLIFNDKKWKLYRAYLLVLWSYHAILNPI